MNPRKFNIAIIIAVVLYLVCIVCCSCSITKAKSSVITDSSSVQKKDSGQLNKTESKENTESTWFREIFMKLDSNAANRQPVYLPGSTTEKYLQPINQPTVYIREGGTMQQQKATITIDSSWKQAYDSLRLQVEAKQLDKKTEVFKGWWIIVLVAGGLLLLWLGRFSGKFSITKK